MAFEFKYPGFVNCTRDHFTASLQGKNQYDVMLICATHDLTSHGDAGPENGNARTIQSGTGSKMCPVRGDGHAGNHYH